MNIATSPPDSPDFFAEREKNVYRDVYEQLVEEASFLWVLRSIAVDQPHYTQPEIHELEQRIDKRLDALMVEVEQVWEICLASLEYEQPGEVFTTAVVAFRSFEVEKIQIAVGAALKNEQTIEGFVSALGWLPGNLVHTWIKKFFTSKDLSHKYLALAACSIRGENPAEYLNRMLERDDCKQDIKLYAQALRLIGEFRRQDLSASLDEALASDNSEIKFWAIWSMILLGNKGAVSHLESYVLQPGPHQFAAINIVFRVLSVEQARELISKLVDDPEQMRAVIKATGVLGDPHAVNWLISNMKEPELARVCAESMCFITGIDLEQYQLINKTPYQLVSEAPPVEAVAQQGDDDPNNDDVSLDEDENLPWPDVEKVSQVWMNLGMNFVAGKRYFLGRQITADLLNEKMLTAYQRQRHAAAMERALMSEEPALLKNTRAREQGS